MLHGVYSQVGVWVPEDGEVATFSRLHIPNSKIDIFLAVRRIPDAMLNLVFPKNFLLLKYNASMDLTSTRAIPKKVTFKVT